MNKLTSLTEQLFSQLGFMTQCISFENIIPDTVFRQKLTSAYNDTEVSRLLQSMPDLFVIHRTAEPSKSAFFIKIIHDKEELNSEIAKIYLRYFPDELAILRLSTKENNISASIKWLKDKNNELMVAKFLEIYGFGTISPEILLNISRLDLAIT